MPKVSWKYHKIMSIFKRHPETKKFIDEYATPEIEYLKNNIWEFTEKIDGTNIRIKYDGENIIYAGRSDNAQIPISLIYKLDEIFKSHDGLKRLKRTFKKPENEEREICLYGEGYGVKIQKGGGNYISDGVGFILFDTVINGWQIKSSDVRKIAKSLNIKAVPIIGQGLLKDAIKMTKKGFNSQFGNFIAEGIVARPLNELKDRKGDRIITKIKYKDFI